MSPCARTTSSASELRPSRWARSSELAGPGDPGDHIEVGVVVAQRRAGGLGGGGGGGDQKIEVSGSLTGAG